MKKVIKSSLFTTFFIILIAISAIRKESFDIKQTNEFSYTTKGHYYQ